MAEAGLEALTLRRLATDLTDGVSAPTLYWHVRNKRQLLDLMAEALVAGAGRSAPRPRDSPGGSGWPSGRGASGERSTHRDAALVVAGNRPTEGPPCPASSRSWPAWWRSASPRRGPAHHPVDRQLRHRLHAVEHQAEAAREACAPERDARLLERAEGLPNLRAAMAAVDRPGRPPATPASSTGWPC